MGYSSDLKQNTPISNLPLSQADAEPDVAKNLPPRILRREDRVIASQVPKGGTDQTAIDDELRSRALAGDSDAFEVFAKRHAGLISRIARRSYNA